MGNVTIKADGLPFRAVLGLLDGGCVLLLL